MARLGKTQVPFTQLYGGCAAVSVHDVRKGNEDQVQRILFNIPIGEEYELITRKQKTTRGGGLGNEISRLSKGDGVIPDASGRDA